MLNALVNLPFLLALAVAGVALWHTLAGNASKVLAALGGNSVLAQAPLATRPVKLRYARRQAPVRVPVKLAAQWRVAA